MLENIPPVTVIMNEDDSNRFDAWVTGKRACFSEDCPTNGEYKCDSCSKRLSRVHRLMKEYREGKSRIRKEGN